MRFAATIFLLLLGLCCSAQSTYLWTEVHPGWKTKAIAYWKNARGYGKKLPEKLTAQIEDNYKFLSGSAKSQLELDLLSAGLPGVHSETNPESLRPQAEDLYVDWSLQLREVTDTYPYFKKELTRFEPAATLQVKVISGTGHLLKDTAITLLVDYKTQVKPKLKSGVSEYELVVEEYKWICSFAIEKSRQAVGALLTRANGQRSASGTPTDNKFTTQVAHLFSPRRLSFPSHYEGVKETPATVQTVSTRTTTPEPENRTAFDDASIATEISSTLLKVKYYSLFIAVNNYKDPGINDLDNPTKDAERLRKVLTESYSFSPLYSKTLIDPTHNQIIEALDELSQKLTVNDNLLIFYAGHGLFDQQLSSGYWLPSDASPKNRSNWISNGVLRDYIRGIPSKHTLLIADACFSGGIFKVREAFSGISQSDYELYKLPSRKAMTSGALKTVPDKSVFLDYLVKRLQENSKPFLSSEVLFANFKAAVINNSPNHQVPQFGEIHETGDEGGDFIFVRKTK